MATLTTNRLTHFHLHFFSSPPKLSKLQTLSFLSQTPKLSFSGLKISASTSTSTSCKNLFCRCELSNLDKQLSDEDKRPHFDINLAVVLAGFAFEAYWSPPENVGTREVDSANCQTVFLSETFLREVYDGELLIKLKKGINFPAMDPWGTSDPYVVMQLDGQVVKSKVKWATKDPIWNEDLTLNIKIPTDKSLQVAVWDANLVTPHKRMGNAGISLESLSDGNLHEVELELEGLGGGGTIQFEVRYKGFDEVEEEKGWKIPYISEFLANNSFESSFKKVFGSDTVKAQQFVQYAFGQIKSFSDVNDEEQLGETSTTKNSSNVPQQQATSPEDPEQSVSVVDGSKVPLQLDSISETDENNKGTEAGKTVGSNERSTILEIQAEESMQSDIWKNFADVINQTVVQKLGFPVLEKMRLDGFDLLNKIGLESKKIAEAEYIDSGLATPGTEDDNIGIVDQLSTVKATPPSLPDIKKLSWDVLRQTDSILGALMVLNSTSSQSERDGSSVLKNETKKTSSTTKVDNVSGYSNTEEAFEESSLEQRKADETKALFSTAESAMEAWALLATSLGQPSFIRSEFEKLCFLDNQSTDTQVAIWRDTVRKRLVIAFRGTEQTKWKDLVTDLMLAPAGLNPERVGGDFKQEVQVHSGFLSAYDSVRTRLMSLIKLSIGFVDDDENVGIKPKWHIYVTGHSLGGALATLLALELSSSQMAKNDGISVTMYNFGSPRVGNRRFVDFYNKKVKDSWRIVNHRDIIPTVPRLMGYCHVAQPIYLAARELPGVLESKELLEDGYQGDVIGEYTPDVLVGEFMKGERELVEKILQTEINLFRAIRDGSALMQHMEDFYYITLLENVRSNYKTAALSDSNEESSI